MLQLSAIRSVVRYVTATSLLLLVLIIAGTDLSAAQRTIEPADAVVRMTNAPDFAPVDVHVAVGETVEWRNTSSVVHTVTADPGQATLAASVGLPEGAEAFHSGNLSPGGVYRHTFTVPGTYRYFCVVHEQVRMTGTVVVE